MSRFQLLSDEQWVLIEELLPVRQGRRFSDARSMVEGIVYRLSVCDRVAGRA